MYMNNIRAIIKESLNKLVEIQNKKLKATDEIHLPELTMGKKELIKFLKDIYNIDLKK
jgi:hypothetical protein